MKLFNKLQEKLLQRDLNKNKTVGELVKKYPVSLLVEKGVLKRYKDTAFYCADTKSGVLTYYQYTMYEDGTTPLYTMSGEKIGKEILQTREYITKQEGAPKYMIIQGFAKFENTERETSYAIYDKNGECVVPHGCYQKLMITDRYSVLSMPSRTIDQCVTRISNDQDEKYQKVLGNVNRPRALILGENKIVTTKYSTIFAVRNLREWDTNEYAQNRVWFAQLDNNCTKSIKIDKRLAVKETYTLPEYIDIDKIYFDEDTNAVYYFTDGKNPKRVNLRNGDEVDLLSLKKIEKAKTTSNKTESDLLHSSMLFADDHTVL